MHEVEVFEQGSREFRSRLSTLDEELKENRGVQRLIFGKGFSPKKCDYLATSSRLDKVHDLIPAEFWSAACNDTNGIFSSKYSYGANGAISGHDTWCCFRIHQLSAISNIDRIESVWDQVAIFIRWRAVSGVGLILCLDCPTDMERRLLGNLQHMASTADPYAWHIFFLKEVVKQHEMSVWSMLMLLRSIEETLAIERYTRTDFHALHILARRIIISKELLEVARLVVESVGNESEFFYQQQRSFSPETCLPIQRSFVALNMEMKTLYRRLESVHERLKNEITLSFNIIAKRQSDITIQIAGQAKADSGIMRMIAVVSLVYLPGMFVSGIFGMEFFNGLVSYADFWIYWAIAVPLTLISMTLWIHSLCRGRD